SPSESPALFPSGKPYNRTQDGCAAAAPGMQAENGGLAKHARMFYSARVNNVGAGARSGARSRSPRPVGAPAPSRLTSGEVSAKQPPRFGGLLGFRRILGQLFGDRLMA